MPLIINWRVNLLFGLFQWVLQISASWNFLLLVVIRMKLSWWILPNMDVWASTGVWKRTLDTLDVVEMFWNTWIPTAQADGNVLSKFWMKLLTLYSHAMRTWSLTYWQRTTAWQVCHFVTLLDCSFIPAKAWASLWHKVGSTRVTNKFQQLSLDEWYMKASFICHPIVRRCSVSLLHYDKAKPRT